MNSKSVHLNMVLFTSHTLPTVLSHSMDSQVFTVHFFRLPVLPKILLVLIALDLMALG